MSRPDELHARSRYPPSTIDPVPDDDDRRLIGESIRLQARLFVRGCSTGSFELWRTAYDAAILAYQRGMCRLLYIGGETSRTMPSPRMEAVYGAAYLGNGRIRRPTREEVAEANEMARVAVERWAVTARLEV